MYIELHLLSDLSASDLSASHGGRAKILWIAHGRYKGTERPHSMLACLSATSDFACLVHAVVEVVLLH